MKKAIFGIQIFYVFVILLIMGMAFFGGGESHTIASAATEEQAYDYQYISSEIGTPWDVALLSDILQSEGEPSRLTEPILTSLQFCIVTEIKNSCRWMPTGEYNEEGEEIYEPVLTQESREDFYGFEEILRYLGKSREQLLEMEITELITAVRDQGNSKSTKDVVYETSLSVNSDYQTVLQEYIGLSGKECDSILQLHQAGYMAQIYGYVFDYDWILPEVVVGQVTRQQLAQVASSLIGHPYLLGGKSPVLGEPAGPLDCSGFVDWVYIQCFGTGVSSGTLPDGVAMSGTALQWYASSPVAEEELKIGDLAFLYDPAALGSGRINHVGIFIGRDAEGTEYFIHCAGRSYGTQERPSGRVGISTRRGVNSYNCVTGGTFTPAMKGCNFRYFRRPNFVFQGEE